MTEISRLKSTPVSLLAVAGLFYFGVLAYFTWTFVALALAGRFSIYVVGFLLACVYSARMGWTWAGLIWSASRLGFRGLYAADGKLAFVAPAIRAVPLAEVTGARAGKASAGPLTHRFLEIDVKGGGKWRIPGFLLRETPETAAQRVKAAAG